MGMHHRYIRGSVAYAMLTVVLLSAVLGHTIAESSVNTTTESPVEIVEKPIERPVVIGEDLVAGVPAIVASCNNPLIRDICRVDVASYGIDDSSPCGYVRTTGGSSEVVLDPNDIRRNRGVVIFELDPITCTTRNRQRFDTWISADDRIQLGEALESATAGTIIIGVAADSAENDDNVAFKNAVNWFFAKYNMNLFTNGLRFRDKFAFIIQKGYPKKSIYRSKPRYGSCLQTSFTLGGNTVADVTFS